MRRRPALIRRPAACLLGAVLSACSVADDIACLDSYCASLESGRYIDHLQLDAGSYRTEPSLQSENLRSVRAVNKGLFRHDPLQSYAEAVLERIVAAGPAPSARPKLVIVANASLNAQSLPGGFVVIHHSLFDHLDNEDQFAFVLGHEYAHYLLDHFSFFDQFRGYAVTAAESVVALRTGDNDVEGRRLLKVYGSDILARDLLYPAWSRRKEDEADRLGVDLMARAGYNPAGAQQYLAIVADYEAAVGRHAEIELNALEQELDAKYGQEDAEEATPSVDPATGRIDAAGFLERKGYEAFRDMQQALAARHEEAVERAAAVAAYAERDYEEESFREFATADWQRALVDSRATLASYNAASEVIATLESEEVAAKELASLEGKARSAVTGLAENDSYTRLANYYLRLNQSKLDLAERNLDLALQGDPQPSFQVIRAKADLLEQQGDPQAAFELLDENGEEFDWPLGAYLAMIRLAPIVGEEDRRLELVVSCAFKYPQSQYACRSTH